MQLEEKTKLKKWLNSFIRTLRPQMFLFLAIQTVFGLIMLFTHVALQLYGYGVLLSLFLWGVSIAFQWTSYFSRLQKAEQIQLNNLKAFEDSIIENEALGEMYYQKYKEITDIYHQFRQTEIEKSKEQMDYFTLWLHQIKTPIAAISLILQRQEVKFAGQKKLEQELIRLEDYTHMALNYLKLEEAGKEMDLERVTVDEVVKEALKKYAILFIYNDIQLQYEPLEMTVLTDRKWLQVLIEQLLSNSLKYTKTGSIKIFAEDETTLVIEDTGVGIRKEDLPRIFEKGYTGLDGRLHEKSTGLGLFLSRKICERLGHQLTIESEINQGTKAHLNLKRESLKVFD